MSWSVSKLTFPHILDAGSPGCQERNQHDSHRFCKRGGDPVAAGLVDSLARPGGNITGVYFTSRRCWLVNDWSYLRKPFSKLSRVAVLWDPQAPGSAQEWKESQLLGTRTRSAALFDGDE